MNTAWAHLPNAAHIDTVLEFVKTHAKHPAWTAARNAARNAAWTAARDAAWTAARNATRDAAWTAARNAAWDAAWTAARNAAWDAALDAALDAAWDTARDAVIALVAWDSAGDLLDRPLTDVQALAALEEPAAVLLLPFMTARENITT